VLVREIYDGDILAGDVDMLEKQGQRASSDRTVAYDEDLIFEFYHDFNYLVYNNSRFMSNMLKFYLIKKFYLIQ